MGPTEGPTEGLAEGLTDDLTEALAEDPTEGLTEGLTEGPTDGVEASPTCRKGSTKQRWSHLPPSLPMDLFPCPQSLPIP